MQCKKIKFYLLKVSFLPPLSQDLVIRTLRPEAFHRYMCGSIHRRCSIEKRVLRNFAKFTGKHLCQRPKTCNFIKKETQAQMFSCEISEISKNTFLQNTSGRLLLHVRIFSHFIDNFPELIYSCFNACACCGE